MSEFEKLNENELNDVVGGKTHSKKKARRVGKCNQCAIKGKMNIDLYKIDNMQFCIEEGHIYKNGVYVYKNKAEIPKI